CLFVGWIKAGGRIHVFMGIIPDLQKIGNAPKWECSLAKKRVAVQAN
ncbi:MAG: hypothetical protein SCABRO_00361, partial [Candidatus Scalindua brodae]